MLDGDLKKDNERLMQVIYNMSKNREALLKGLPNIVLHDFTNALEAMKSGFICTRLAYGCDYIYRLDRENEQYLQKYEDGGWEECEMSYRDNDTQDWIVGIDDIYTIFPSNDWVKNEKEFVC